MSRLQSRNGRTLSFAPNGVARRRHDSVASSKGVGGEGNEVARCAVARVMRKLGIAGDRWQAGEDDGAEKGCGLPRVVKPLEVRFVASVIWWMVISN